MQLRVLQPGGSPLHPLLDHPAHCLGTCTSRGTCHPARLPVPRSCAGALVTPLQKTRMLALSAPLHPDVVSTVREGLNYFGLLPPEMAALCAGKAGAGLAEGAATPAATPSAAPATAPAAPLAAPADQQAG